MALISEKQSNIELLRIILMVSIVMHHIISQVISPNFSSHAWSCVDVVLHTAVVIFVLISGYFRIHFSWSNLLKLLLQVIYYSIILSFIVYCIEGHGVSIYDLMPFSNCYYWFVTTYLQLYLISYFINKLLDHCSNQEFFYMAAVLAFFIFYLGFLRKMDICQDGKNLLNFVFIYQIGYGIRRYQAWFQRMKKYIPLMMIAMLSVIGLCYFIPDKNYYFIHSVVFLYKYNSPFLILLSSIIFLIFLNLNIRSSVINNLAASSFSIYLIHGHPLFWKYSYFIPFKSILHSWHISDVTLLGVLLLYSVLLSLSCIIFDKIRLFLFSLIIKNKHT